MIVKFSMGFIQFNEKPVSRPKIRLTAKRFETKAVGFCKGAAVVVFFNKFFTAREWNDRQTFKWMNSIKFIVSLLAKHWTYQTLNECINAVLNVVILPIEKYKSARRRC